MLKIDIETSIKDAEAHGTNVENIKAQVEKLNKEIDDVNSKFATA